MALQVGRVGIDGGSLGDPFQISERMDIDGSKQVTIGGYIRSTTTLAEANALRTELQSQVGKLVAVVYSGDSTVDGFYWMDSASVEANAARRSLDGTGFFMFNVGLRFVGNGDVLFQSQTTTAVLANDHSITFGTNGLIGPPMDFSSYTPSRSTLGRAGEDGTTNVTYQVNSGDAPIWAVSPADFYKNSAKVLTNGEVRAGEFTHTDAPTSWEINNGLLRLVGRSGGVTASVWDSGAWRSGKDYNFDFSGTNMPAITSFAIVRNDPEVVIVRIEAPRFTGSGSGRRTVTLTLRRGAFHCAGVMTSDANATLKLERASTDAATAISGPGPDGLRDSANDSDGNRWVMSSPNTMTKDTTNGAISIATVQEFKFMLGYELGGSGAATGNAAADLIEQYHAHITEKVLPKTGRTF